MIFYCFRDETNWDKKISILSDDFWDKWNDINQKKYLKKYKKYFDLWNKTQTISLFQYRHELKKISESAFEDAGIIKINLESWRDLSDDDWLIPQDDDDFFCPGFRKYIDFADESLVYGNKLIFHSGFHNKFEIYCQKNTKKISSCGYAFRIKDLKRMDDFNSFVDIEFEQRGFKKKFTDAECIIKFHYFVKDLAERHNLKIKFIDQISSCKNWHPGSFSEISRDSNFEILNKYKTPFVDQNKPNIIKEAKWAESYVEEMIKLIKKLKTIKFL